MNKLGNISPDIQVKTETQESSIKDELDYFFWGD